MTMKRVESINRVRDKNDPDKSTKAKDDKNQTLDVVCRIVFPFCFVAFNIYFWTHFSQADKIDKKPNVL